MSYQGDFKLGDTVTFKFNSTVPTTGVLTTLAGSPTYAAYLDSTTEITAGITVTQDYDARTGMHHVSIAATAGNGYAAGKNYSVQLTAGTCGGVSLVGLEVGCFSIENRVQNIASTPVLTGAYPAIGIAESGTAAGIAATTLTARGAGTSFGTNDCTGMTLWAFGSTQGEWQSRSILSNTSGTSAVFTVDAWTTTPSGTVTYILWGTSPSASTGVTVSPTSVRSAIGMSSANLDTQIAAVQTSASNIQTRVPAALVGGRMASDIQSVLGTQQIGTGVPGDNYRPTGTAAS